MKKSVFMFLILSHYILFAQNEGNIWYFGQYAGIDFNLSKPAALLNSSMVLGEGSASISDSQGNLLFYTNGSRIWNANHDVMNNGGGLSGHHLSSQPSLIVKLPQSDSIYYVFTTSDWGLGNGMFYNIVDMALDSGLGAITLKNQPLNSLAREQLISVYHENCDEIWIIAHEKGNNKFVSYLLSSSGLNTTPVGSFVGMVYVGPNRYGNLKASNSGRQICSTLGGSNNITVELYDFNKSTGRISNPLSIASNLKVFSSEFSPNDSILYVTGVGESYIDQYDISIKDSTAIIASKINVSTSPIRKVCLQIGPDKKIYVSRAGENYVGVISDPDIIGTSCNYLDSGLFLGSNRIANYGFPNFSKGRLPINIGSDTAFCQGDTLTIDATTLNATYLWQDGSTNPKFKVTQQGTYSVIITVNNCTLEDAINVSYRPMPTTYLGNDTTLCQGEKLTLDATNVDATYIWQDSSGKSTFNVKQQGTYWVQVITSCGISTDTIKVNYVSKPTVNLGNDTTLCEGAKLTLNAKLDDASYIWNNGSTDSFLTIEQEGLYWVNVTTSICNITDTILIKYNSIPVINLGNDTALCEGEKLLLDATVLEAAYLWQDGSTSHTFEVDQFDTFWVTITVNGCSFIDSILIEEEDCRIILEMPNVFTPNNDGLNDLFIPIRMNGIVPNNLKVYNRWGKQMNVSDKNLIVWDGASTDSKIVAEGVYYWIISFIDLDGKTREAKGEVMVLH